MAIYTKRKGFTLIELLVSVAIFTFMTALLVVKYGNFNQSVLLTNLAYDVALTLRTAQTYGLSVKGVEGDDLLPFQYVYGVHFDAQGNDKKKFIMFASSDNDHYDPTTDKIISTYSIKRGANISNICWGSSAGDCQFPQGGQEKVLDIAFRRPDPEAIICANDVCTNWAQEPYTYAKIILQGSDGSTRSVAVRSNGQITVQNQ